MRSLMSFFQGQHRDRAHRQVRREVRLESLETRNLLSGGAAGTVPAGISVQNGELCIVGTLHSGNVASVSIDKTTKNLLVTLNGSSVEFSQSQVSWVAYESGAGGHDTFTNDTSLYSLDYGYGGGNTFNGGTGMSEYLLYGNGNVVNNEGGWEVVFTNGGNDTIAPDSGGLVIIA